jgi:hypothetical protein
MKIIKLKEEERTLLFYCVQAHRPKLLQKISQLEKGLLSNDTVNEIRGAVTDELTDRGFKSDWEPNEYGIKLENLIDKLGNFIITSRPNNKL